MSNFETQPLENKPFDLGSQDCFTLVRDFYKLNFGIDMPNFARPNDWNPEKDDIINNSYVAAGFEKLDAEESWPPRPADLLVTTVGGSTPNHLVVYLGNNEILHHKDGLFSSKETLRPAWKRYTSYLLRHPDLPDLTERKPTLTLEEAYSEKLV